MGSIAALTLSLRHSPSPSPPKLFGLVVTTPLPPPLCLCSARFGMVLFCLGWYSQPPTTTPSCPPGAVRRFFFLDQRLGYSSQSRSLQAVQYPVTMSLQVGRVAAAGGMGGWGRETWGRTGRVPPAVPGGGGGGVGGCKYQPKLNQTNSHSWSTGRGDRGWRGRGQACVRAPYTLPPRPAPCPAAACVWLKLCGRRVQAVRRRSAGQQGLD